MSQTNKYYLKSVPLKLIIVKCYHLVTVIKLTRLTKSQRTLVYEEYLFIVIIHLMLSVMVQFKVNTLCWVYCIRIENDEVRLIFLCRPSKY
jgi:hypothetical protein